MWRDSYLSLLSFTFQAFVFCNVKDSKQLQLRLVSVSRRSLYTYSSWAFMGIQVQLGGVSMFRISYSPYPDVVLIAYLITYWRNNPYMLSSKVGKSISKGFNPNILAKVILSCLQETNKSTSTSEIAGMAIVLSGRLMGNLMKRTTLTADGLCVSTSEIAGMAIVLSGRLMGNLMKRTTLTADGLCVSRYGNRILDFGQVTLNSTIGTACIKVGIGW